MYFDPALEFRKFVQKPRTIDERQAKLTALALQVKETSDKSFKEILTSIVDSYRKGEDLLDPDIFEKEDLVAFAKKNRIRKDPMMIAFINMARTREEWETTKN